MEKVVKVCQHDARRLTRVVLTDEAAAELRRWKTETWTEYHGHGTGQTAEADGAVQETLTAVAAAVEGAGIDEMGIGGNYHAVIVGEGGELVHATYVGCTGGRYYLAG